MYACLGGYAEYGNTVLRAENIRYTGMLVPTLQMYNKKLSFPIVVSKSRVIQVSVAHIEKDSGGIIYTIFKLDISKVRAYPETKFIKVQSKYYGDGVMMDEPEFDISETFEC